MSHESPSLGISELIIEQVNENALIADIHWSIEPLRRIIMDSSERTKDGSLEDLLS